MKEGYFISLEGADGSGKTTGAKFLVEYLQKKGFKVHHTREPGGSDLAEKIRNLIFQNEMSGLTEALLFAAARSDHIAKVIEPKLKEGYVVVCDRYVDSTYAYQARGRGLPGPVLQLEAMVASRCMPDKTLFFDVSETVADKRLSARNEDHNRLDNEKREFKRLVTSGYYDRFDSFKARMHRIDANMSVVGVESQLKHFVDNSPELQLLKSYVGKEENQEA